MPKKPRSHISRFGLDPAYRRETRIYTGPRKPSGADKGRKRVTFLDSVEDRVDKGRVEEDKDQYDDRIFTTEMDIPARLNQKYEDEQRFMQCMNKMIQFLPCTSITKEEVFESLNTHKMNFPEYCLSHKNEILEETDAPSIWLSGLADLAMTVREQIETYTHLPKLPY